MREIRSYGSVGVSAGDRRHYPARTEMKFRGFIAVIANDEQLRAFAFTAGCAKVTINICLAPL